MKLIYNLFFSLFLVGGFLLAQEKSPFLAQPKLKFYGSLPSSFGDNMLGEAHDGKMGFGISVSPFSIYNFNIGVGFDFTQYDVTEVSLAGNIDRSELMIVYGFVSYPIELGEKFAIEPKLGAGGTKLRQKTSSENLGNMKGFSFLIGTDLEYKIIQPLSVFLGADFIHSSYNIQAHPENEKFFDRSQVLNIHLGLKFNLFKAKSEMDTN
jgi:hypothetical protein